LVKLLSGHIVKSPQNRFKFKWEIETEIEKKKGKIKQKKYKEPASGPKPTSAGKHQPSPTARIPV
jgi:hypothetical protein